MQQGGHLVLLEEERKASSGWIVNKVMNNIYYLIQIKNVILILYMHYHASDVASVINK